jgi:hypothetical protein
MKKAHLAALTLLAAACAGDLPPRSVLQDLRVLALLANPLEAQPGDQVTVGALTIAPPGATVSTVTWSFCPFTVGATESDACAVPACERKFGLDEVVNGQVTADPGAEAVACLQKLGAAGASAAGLPSQIPDQLQTLFRYVVTASDNSSREAVLRIPFYPRGVPAARNQPPVVTSLTVGGQAMVLATPPVGSVATVPKGGQLEVRVTLDPSSVQRYLDSAGRAIDEQPFVSFYTTAGRFDFDRGTGLDENVQLKDEKVPPDVTSAQVYAVAHDDRGGATVLGPYTVDFVR